MCVCVYIYNLRYADDTDDITLMAESVEKNK